ncbi:FAD-dependent oxidoreductase [Geminicoccaceae bacterium 1502E]|nr:FAD-dependent oxidoreductase [Geminicoccaceae bacterium 1502E]
MISFPHLFSPLKVGGMEIRNRILSTGHDTVLAHEGRVTDRLVAYHEARAKGGAGLIVVQVAGVHETARYTSHILMATSDDAIPGYAALAGAVHRHGAKICGQLFHPGREIMETDDGTAPAAYAPSAVPNSRFHVMPVPLSLRMIREIVKGYGDAARRLMQAGFDGCEIVASHGYLPAQFLNPNVNEREDAYGGSVENRLRFLREVAVEIRSGTSPDFVVGLRITGEEHDSRGPEPSEILTFCKMLDGDGIIDYFSVVAGTSASLKGSIHIVPPMTWPDAYSAPFAAAVKSAVTRPVFVAGRINQPQTAEQLVASGQTDMCGMTRAMICDPEMPSKAEAGRVDDIRACIACNQACIGHFHKGYPISCIQHPETGRELTLGRKPRTSKPRRVIVAGGGPAGMKAAAVLAARGHDVSLHEAAAQLGGQALVAQLLPGRAEFGGIVTNLTQEMILAGVKIHRQSPVTRAMVEAEGADAVVVATGGKPRWPRIEGGDDTHIVDATQVLTGLANVGASALIADWRSDWVGLGLAEKLARDGCRVRLCVEGIAAGETIPGYVRDSMVATLHKLGVEITTYARLFGADGNVVYMEHCASGEPIIFEDIDTLVLAQGQTRVAALEAELDGFPGEVHVIGDALTPRTAEEAVLEGLKAGLAI